MSDVLHLYLIKMADRRKEMGMSIAELSSLSKVSEKTIRKYEEKGFTSIPIDQFMRLIDVLEFSFDEFESFIKKARLEASEQ